ncbi:unnamed protein product [Adineta steineri]|uniref:Chitin-binding type-2 domain-containing protein n=1 Tax=Adineta steineri TaxID=433720 RepID=A0A814TGN3_9BILA|nr:unnamed protein product [Adineta steineri]CAF1355535.1 unnamed protein product [Adineta steineri]
MIIAVFILLSMMNFTTARRIFRCPEKDIDEGCKDPLSCMYPNPNDCNGFIQCDDSGRIYYKSCNPGLLWNDIIRNCDIPRHSTCGFYG